MYLIIFIIKPPCLLDCWNLWDFYYFYAENYLQIVLHNIMMFIVALDYGNV